LLVVTIYAGGNRSEKVCGVFIADTKKVEAFLGKIIIRQLHASSRIDFMFSTYTGIQ
jgi:hypothetical protein